MHFKSIHIQKPRVIQMLFTLALAMLTSICFTTDTHAAGTTADVKADFGAIGDGIADDSDAIIQAINSDASIIIIPEGQYRITKQIRITKSGKTIIGEKATLFATDDEYVNPTTADLHAGITEGLLQIGDAFLASTNNVTIKGVHLNVRAGASNIAPVPRLAVIVNATGIHFDSCAFTSDHSLLESQSARGAGGIVALDFFGVYRDVSVTNSTVRLLHTRTSNDGGGVYFRAYWNSPVSDIVFTNNTIYKIGPDEVFWLEVNGTETMTNVEISGNRLYMGDELGGGPFCFATSAHAGEADKVKNVKFHDNEIIHHGISSTIILHSVENFDLYDNDIYTNVTRLGAPVKDPVTGESKQYYTGSILGSRGRNTTDTVKVHDNRTMTLDSKVPIGSLASGDQPYHVYNNPRIIVNAPTTETVINHRGTFVNNNVTVNSNVMHADGSYGAIISSAAQDVRDNHILIHGYAPIFLRNYNANLTAPVTYTGNTITTTKKSPNPSQTDSGSTHLAMMWSFSMNGHPITIRDNTFINGSEVEDDTSLELRTVANTGSNTATARDTGTHLNRLWWIYGIEDAAPADQNVYICNNTTKGFGRIPGPWLSPTINLTCN